MIFQGIHPFLSLLFKYRDLLENRYHLKIDLVLTLYRGDNVQAHQYSAGHHAVEKEYNVLTHLRYEIDVEISVSGLSESKVNGFQRNQTLSDY